MFKETKYKHTNNQNLVKNLKEAKYIQQNIVPITTLHQVLVLTKHQLITCLVASPLQLIHATPVKDTTLIHFRVQLNASSSIILAQHSCKLKHISSYIIRI